MDKLREIDRRKPDILPIVILLLLGIAYFFPVLFMGRSPAINSLRTYEPWRTSALAFGEGTVERAELTAPEYKWDEGEGFADDLNRQFIPWGTFCQDEIRSGHWPLWNPHVSSGQPMFANHQTGITNPLLLLCYLIFPGLGAFTAIFLTIFILAGWGMYSYLRVLGLGRWPSLLAAVTYQYMLGYIPTLDTLVVEKALFPFLLLSIEMIFRSNGRRSGQWTGLSIVLLALVQTTCHAQEAVYISYLTAPYIVFIAGGRDVFQKGKAWWSIGRRLVLAAGIFIIALILGLIQNLPTAEFYGMSTRMAGFTEQLETTSEFEESLNWIVSLMIAFPRLYGDYIRDNFPLEHYLLNYGYVGIVTILAAPFAGWVGDNRRQVWFWRIACLIFFIALISNWFYMNILATLPLFRVSLQPPFSPFFFGLIVLAGHGFSFMLKPRPSKSSGSKIMGYTSVLVFGGFVSIFGLYIYSLMTAQDAIVEEQAYVYGQVTIGLLYMALACLVVAIFWRYVNSSRAKNPGFDSNPALNMAVLALLVIILIDLWPVKAHFNPYIKKEKLLPPSITTNFLSQNLGWEPGDPDGPYRFGRSWKDALPPNTGMMYGIDDFGGYDSNLPGRYAELLTAVDPSILVGVHYIETPRYRDGFNSKLWNMLGVKYVVGHPDHLGQFNPEGQWRHVYKGELLIMENVEALPRMHLVDKIYFAPGDGDELELASTLDPAIEAVVYREENSAREFQPETPATPGAPGTVVISEYEASRVVAGVDLVRPALLCFYDNWFPGWEVSVDGNPERLERVNYTFKGVLLEEGQHEVVFSYRPKTFLYGWIGSLIGLMLVLLLSGPLSKLVGIGNQGSATHDT